MTYTALAAKLGIARENVWRMRRRHPGLEGWVSEQISAGNDTLIGPVVRKCGLMGIQGSVKHAELYLRTMGRLNETPSAPNGMTFNGPTIVNLAVPRPGDPPIHASAGRLPEEL